MKTCTKCGDTKPTAEFSKKASGRDGLMAYCKACDRAAVAAWGAANPEKKKAAIAAWQKANPEKCRAYNAKCHAANPGKSTARKAKFRAANPEKIRAAGAKYYAANQDKIKATAAAYRAANQEKRRAYNAAWYAASPEKRRAAGAAWYAANPEARRVINQNRRARKRANGGRLSTGIADKLFKLQRGKCACGCKQSLGTDYHLDHRMPVALGGANEDWNIQLLRQRCNNQKHAKHPIEFMQQRGFLL